jgi:hypothetical protein
MALARGVDHEEYLAVAKDSESEHLIEMADYMARMMSPCTMPAQPAALLHRVDGSNTTERDFTDTDIDIAVLRFAERHKLPRDCPVPVRDIGEGDYGGARLRPLHSISLILRGPALCESDATMPHDISGLVPRIKRAISRYNTLVEASEQQRDVRAEHSDHGLQPLTDVHLADGVREFVRIFKFPSDRHIPEYDNHGKWKPLQRIRRILEDDGLGLRGFDIAGLTNRRIKAAISQYNRNIITYELARARDVQAEPRSPAHARDRRLSTHIDCIYQVVARR